MGAQWPFTNLQKLDISYKPLPLLGYDDDVLNEWHRAHCHDASMASMLSRLPHLTHLAARSTHFGGLTQQIYQLGCCSAVLARLMVLVRPRTEQLGRTLPFGTLRVHGCAPDRLCKL